MSTIYKKRVVTAKNFDYTRVVLTQFWLKLVNETIAIISACIINVLENKKHIKYIF